MAVGHGGRCDGELHQAEEEHASRARVAAVGVEAELVEVRIEVLGANHALVGAKQPALEQGSRRGATGNHQRARWAALLAQHRLLVLIAVIGNILEGLVAVGVHGGSLAPSARVTNGIKLSFVIPATRCIRIRPKPLGCSISIRDRDEAHFVYVSRPRSPFSMPPIRVAPDLRKTAQLLGAGAHHCGAVAVQHRPRRLVGAQPQYALKPQRRDAVLLADHLPGGGEPHRQRRAGVMEDRARGARHPPATPSAGLHAIRHLPAGLTAAVWAHEAVRPAQPVQIVQTRRIVGEPCAQFPVGPWVVQGRPWHGANVQGQSDGYPLRWVA